MYTFLPSLTVLFSNSCVHVLEIDRSSERNTIWPLMVFYKLNLTLEMYLVGQPWPRQ
jgi:hypothetical protein